jgi:hypothetical protein
MFCSDRVQWGSTRKMAENTNRRLALNQTLKDFQDVYVIFGLTLLMIIVLCLPFIPDEWRITSAQSIVPLTIISIVHMLAPIVLNPYITSHKMRYL